MARPSRFSEAEILGAATDLVASGGPRAATIGAIGAAIGAPWGSIYHRFPSRHVLLGQLWLRKAAMFQDRFTAALALPDATTAGLEAALSLPRTARADFAGARIMLMYAREDFLSDEWPSDMQKQAARLKSQVDDAMKDITRRLFRRASGETSRLAVFAILDVPFAATRRHIAASEPPPAFVDGLVEKAYRGLIAPNKLHEPKTRTGS